MRLSKGLDEIFPNPTIFVEFARLLVEKIGAGIHPWGCVLLACVLYGNRSRSPHFPGNFWLSYGYFLRVSFF